MRFLRREGQGGEGELSCGKRYCFVSRLLTAGAAQTLDIETTELAGVVFRKVKDDFGILD